MIRRTVTLIALAIAGTLAFGCSSTDKPAAKKPASGQAAAKTTRKPTALPAPQKKVTSGVGANQSSASKTEEVCTADDEGKGVCVDEFVVFCAGQALYALDCAAAFGGTCGSTETEIGCLVEEAAE